MPPSAQPIETGQEAEALICWSAGSNAEGLWPTTAFDADNGPRRAVCLRADRVQRARRDADVAGLHRATRARLTNLQPSFAKRRLMLGRFLHFGCGYRGCVDRHGRGRQPVVGHCRSDKLAADHHGTITTIGRRTSQGQAVGLQRGQAERHHHRAVKCGSTVRAIRIFTPIPRSTGERPHDGRQRRIDRRADAPRCRGDRHQRR
jgi:hypothetical protein